MFPQKQAKQTAAEQATSGTPCWLLSDLSDQNGGLHGISATAVSPKTHCTCSVLELVLLPLIRKWSRHKNKGKAAEEETSSGAHAVILATATQAGTANFKLAVQQPC